MQDFVVGCSDVPQQIVLICDDRRDVSDLYGPGLFDRVFLLNRMLYQRTGRSTRVDVLYTGPGLFDPVRGVHWRTPWLDDLARENGGRGREI